MLLERVGVRVDKGIEGMLEGEKGVDKLKTLAVGSRCRVRWLMVLINLTVGSLELSSRLVGVSGNLTTNSTG